MLEAFKQPPKFPSVVSALCTDLITKLLAIDPTKRISLEEVKRHPWYVFGPPAAPAGFVPTPSPSLRTSGPIPPASRACSPSPYTSSSFASTPSPCLSPCLEDGGEPAARSLQKIKTLCRASPALFSSGPICTSSHSGAAAAALRSSGPIRTASPDLAVAIRFGAAATSSRISPAGSPGAVNSPRPTRQEGSPPRESKAARSLFSSPSPSAAHVCAIGCGCLRA